MKLRFTTNIVLVAGTVLLLLSLAAIIIFSISRSKQVKETTRWIAHTQEVLIQSEKLVSAVSDNEASSRGFVITSQPSFLQMLDRSQKDIYNIILRLKQLTEDNPVQQNNIDSVQYYTDKRISFSNHTVSARQYSGFDNAMALVESGEGRVYSGLVKQWIGKVQAHENTLLDKRKKANDDTVGGQFRMLMIILGTVLLLMLFFFQKVRMDIADRKKAAAALQQLNAELETKAETRAQELLQARSFLLETFERITDAFMGLDTAWRITYMNRKAGEIMKRDPETMTGKHIWTEFPQSVGQNFYNAYHKAMETQEYIYLEDYSPSMHEWFEVHIYPSPNGLSVFFCEITQKKIAEINLRNSEEKYRLLVERISDSFIALDKNWNYTYINKSAGELIHRDPQELIGKNVWEVFPEAVNSATYHLFHKAYAEQRYLYNEDYYPPLDLWQENHVYPSPEGISVFIRDITEKKRAERKILKANRLYFFISQINQMIVRVTNEDVLFKEACRISVEQGNFKMAWIGMVNEKNNQLEPVMYAGDEKAFLHTITPIVLKAEGSMHLPAHRAVDEEKVFTCNDIETGPFTEQWRKEALSRDYQSCMSLPVKKFGKVTGAFTFFAAEKNFFDSAELALLEEATGDVSFALEVIEKERMRKKAEEGVLNSEKRFRAMIENSTDGLAVIGADGMLRELSPSATRILGYPESEMLGKVHLGKIHPDDLQLVLQTFNRLINDPSEIVTIEYRHRLPNGDYKWLECSFRNMLQEPYLKGVVMNYHDITQRKTAELKIKENEEKYRRAQQIGKMGHWELDVKNNRLSWSDEIYRIFDVDRRQLSSNYEAFFNAIHPEDREAFNKALEDALTGRRALDFIHRIIVRDDIVLFAHEMAELVRGTKGEPLYLTGTVQDVTDLIKAQDDIVKERDLSESIVNSLPGIFYLYDLEGRFLRWNDNFERVSGYNNEEIATMHPLDFFDEDEKQLLTEKISNVFVAGEDNVQASFLTKAGKKIPYYFTGIAIDYEGGKCLMGVGLDFSERVEAQEIIKQSSEQLRQLTAHLQNIREEERKRIGREIHDELGQQLTAIKMDIAWINRRIPDDAEPVKAKLSNTMKLLDSGNQSIRRILNELRPVILDDYGLLEALRWQGRQFSTNTGISLDFVTTETQVKLPEAAATCLFRVYQEALNNITKYAEAQKVNSSLVIAMGYAILRIEDDGKGFDIDSVKNKNSFGILGMKERVLSLKGEFELQSTPGAGTRISVRIPADTDQLYKDENTTYTAGR